MTLPKIAVPTFELKQPSTEQMIQFRPFLVREEKALLIAKESAESSDVFNAMKQIISACVLTEKFNVDDIPLFDMEYIFLKIRSKSIDNVIKFQVKDSTDGKTYDLELDLEEVEVHYPEKVDRKIMISDSVGVMLKHLTPAISDKIKIDGTAAEIVFSTIFNSIECVFDEENVFPWSDYTKEEKTDFIESLPIESYKDMQKFFDSTPSLRHEVTYENSEGVTKRVVFRSLDDFFTLH
jgi:hypothetical protein